MLSLWISPLEASNLFLYILHQRLLTRSRYSAKLDGFLFRWGPKWEKKNLFGGTSVVCVQIILNCKICTPIVSLLHYTKLYQGNTNSKNKTPHTLEIFSIHLKDLDAAFAVATTKGTPKLLTCLFNPSEGFGCCFAVATTKGTPKPLTCLQIQTPPLLFLLDYLF